MIVISDEVQNDLRVLRDSLKGFRVGGLKLPPAASALSLDLSGEHFVMLAQYLVEQWGAIHKHKVKYSREIYPPGLVREKMRLSTIEDLGLEVWVDVMWTGEYFEVLDVEFINSDTGEIVEVG